MDFIDVYVEVVVSNGWIWFKCFREGGWIVEVGIWVVMNELGRFFIWVDN